MRSLDEHRIRVRAPWSLRRRVLEIVVARPTFRWFQARREGDVLEMLVGMGRGLDVAEAWVELRRLASQESVGRRGKVLPTR
jgi:hypothetical protein